MRSSSQIANLLIINSHTTGDGDAWGRVTESLLRIGNRLCMHILLKEENSKKEFFVVPIHFMGCSGIDLFYYPVMNPLHVLQCCIFGRQRKVPSFIVCDTRGVVHQVSLAEHRLQLPEMTQEPVLLEPGHVCDLPAQRIDNGETWSDHLFIVQVSHEFVGTSTGLLQGIDEIRDGMSMF